MTLRTGKYSGRKGRGRYKESFRDIIIFGMGNPCKDGDPCKYDEMENRSCFEFLHVCLRVVHRPLVPAKPLSSGRGSRRESISVEEGKGGGKYHAALCDMKHCPNRNTIPFYWASEI